MKSHLMPLNVCSACGYEHDAASIVGGSDHRPRPGDMSLCINCGHLAAFDEQLRLREPTAAEREATSRDPRVFEAMTVIKLRGPFK